MVIVVAVAASKFERDCLLWQDEIESPLSVQTSEAKLFLLGRRFFAFLLCEIVIKFEYIFTQSITSNTLIST